MRVDEVQAHTPFVRKEYWGNDAPFQYALARQFSQTKQGQRLWPELSKRLANYSILVEKEARPLAKLCDRVGSEPSLIQFNEWGQRIDEVQTSEGWRGLLKFQIRTGIVGESFPKEGQEEIVCDSELSAGGRDRLGEWARLYNFTRILLFSPDSQVAVCPTSMTDGAARVLELYGTEKQKQTYLPRIFKRKGEGWFSGQWMTEVAGGSDVSMTETIAEPLIAPTHGTKSQPGDLFVINGFKWFSSAADGNMTLALARTDKDRKKGSKGLSLFLIPLHKKDRPDIPVGINYVDQTSPSSKYNGLKIHRLKNKLGTKHVPTAEIEICGAIGELIGEEGRGVAQIAQVLNLTRTYNIMANTCSVGTAVQILQDYSNRRKVGVHGAAETLIKDLPLHTALIAKITIHHRAILQFFLQVTRLLGKSEARTITQREERRLRLLTPVGKGFCAVRANECLSQSIECVGGQGYMHESPLTTALRDDLVSRIWEGTPSVLSLDVVRVLIQSKGKALIEWIQDSNDSIQACVEQLQQFSSNETFKQTISTMQDTLKEIQKIYLDLSVFQTDKNDFRLARPLLDAIAIIECGCQLVNQAAWSTSSLAKDVPHGDAQLELQIAFRWICGPEGNLQSVRSTMKNLKDGIFDLETENRIAYGLDRESRSSQELPTPRSTANASHEQISFSAKSKL